MSRELYLGGLVGVASCAAPLTLVRVKARVLILVFLVVAACGGADEDPVVPTRPADALIPEDEAIYRQIFETAINQTGLTLPVERWVQLAEAGCRQGAWQRPVAQGLAQAFIDSLDEDQQEHLEFVGAPGSVGEISRLIWMISLAGCRDEFPQAEIERGPPVATSVVTVP